MRRQNCNYLNRVEFIDGFTLGSDSKRQAINVLCNIRYYFERYDKPEIFAALFIFIDQNLHCLFIILIFITNWSWTWKTSLKIELIGLSLTITSTTSSSKNDLEKLYRSPLPSPFTSPNPTSSMHTQTQPPKQALKNHKLAHRKSHHALSISQLQRRIVRSSRRRENKKNCDNFLNRKSK